MINGIDADEYDFGEGNDDDPGNAPDYGCGCHRFHGEPAKPEVLEKYHITPEEYEEVVRKLEDVLYVGGCSWCV